MANSKSELLQKVREIARLYVERKEIDEQIQTLEGEVIQMERGTPPAPPLKSPPPTTKPRGQLRGFQRPSLDIYALIQEGEHVTSGTVIQRADATYGQGFYSKSAIRASLFRLRKAGHLNYDPKYGYYFLPETKD